MAESCLLVELQFMERKYVMSILDRHNEQIKSVKGVLIVVDFESVISIGQPLMGGIWLLVEL